MVFGLAEMSFDDIREDDEDKSLSVPRGLRCSDAPAGGVPPERRRFACDMWPALPREWGGRVPAAAPFVVWAAHLV